MGPKGRLVVLVLVGVFAWSVRWAETNSPAVLERQARAAQAGDCRHDAMGRVVPIRVSVSKYPENWRHIVDARAGRNTGPDGVSVVNDGLKWPTVLRKNDVGEEARRRAGEKMSGLPSKPGKARDEYPPAEGRATDAADFRYVDRDTNSRQGASMGGQLRRYCKGQLYQLVAVP
jgi:hypothetical protein